MEFFKFEEMQIIPPENLSVHFNKRTKVFLETEDWFFSRFRKGKERTSNLKQLIKEISFRKNILNLTKTIVGASFFDFLREFYDIERGKTGGLEIIRKRMLRM